MDEKVELMEIHPLIALKHGIRDYYKYDRFAVVNYEDCSELLLEGYIKGKREIIRSEGYAAMQDQIEQDRRKEELKYMTKEICKTIKEELRK